MLWVRLVERNNPLAYLRSFEGERSPSHPRRTSRLAGGSNTTVTFRLAQGAREARLQARKRKVRASCRPASRCRVACDRRIAGSTSCLRDSHGSTGCGLSRRGFARSRASPLPLEHKWNVDRLSSSHPTPSRRSLSQKVWWLQREIFALSRYCHGGKFKQYSNLRA